MHYLLFYEKSPDYAARQGSVQDEHLAYVVAAAERGDILLAGSLTDPSDGGAVLLFETNQPDVIRTFAEADPYVVHGIVNRWYIRGWQTVVGKLVPSP